MFTRYSLVMVFIAVLSFLTVVIPLFSVFVTQVLDKPENDLWMTDIFS